jgi:hypothetical protein
MWVVGCGCGGVCCGVGLFCAGLLLCYVVVWDYDTIFFPNRKVT